MPDRLRTRGLRLLACWLIPEVLLWYLFQLGVRVSSSRALVRLLALTCGITIANVYYPQPLLATIAHDLGASRSAAGNVVTATQLGFALALVLIVPLGDIVARRPLITAMLTVDALALAGSAAAPNPGVLTALAVVIGASSAVVQMVIPYAATVTRTEERARVIGLLMGSVLLGVLLSRTVAGVVADLAGWRWVYALAAVAMVSLAAIVYRALPAEAREVQLGYLAQMRAVVRLARREPVLRWRAVVGAGQFGTFSCFWSTVPFLLAGRPFGFTQAGIGAFALVGAAGAASVLTGGRLLDRWRRLRWRFTGHAIAGLLCSFGLLVAGGHSLILLIAGALLMDICAQAVHVTNQAVIYDLVDAARARITTVYMTTYFFGGALGTTAGIAAYVRFGWGGACAVSVAFCGIAALGWWATRRPERLNLDERSGDPR